MAPFFDMMTFDGGSNFQKGAVAMTAFHPRTTVTHGAEHIIALFFTDLAKEPLVSQIEITLC
jgi:hypothetical protein